MAKRERWIDWIVELQSLAQAGLTYGKDAFDLERYQRIREIAAGMMGHFADLPMETVKDLFCSETGYQTPKIDTRAAIFENGKILLVQEKDGRWSLPGGWCDVNVSVGENTAKEVKEEAGVDVRPERMIAVQDRSKHNQPPYAYGVCKIFFLCTLLGGQFEENIETTGFAYFSEDALPLLAVEKNTEEQIRMCFAACRAGESWTTQFD